jgi:hypothetical protein
MFALTLRRRPLALLLGWITAAGCTAAREDSGPELPAEPCSTPEALCDRIAAGDWTLPLAVDDSTPRMLIWLPGCAASVEEAVQERHFADRLQWKEAYIEWREGFWFDLGWEGRPWYRLVDCALVTDTDFPDMISPQLHAAQDDEVRDRSIFWDVAPDAPPSSVAELVLAMEGSWDWADEIASTARHFVYAATFGVEEGAYRWHFCRVIAEDLESVFHLYLVCHEYAYDPDARRMEMSLRWGKPLPCDPGSMGDRWSM